mmetsp:Transcript_58057/g.79116  ORF Transcript_58057/g.79116 Transcript_58057/m.79116 type:complete len:217 (+) Transcript_58057:961-1611(+)
MGKVCGRCIQVMVLGPGLDVEISRHPVHHEETNDHATRMVRVPVCSVGCSRFRPLLVLGLELKFALGEFHEGFYGAVRAVVGPGDGLAVLEEAECREGLDALGRAGCVLFYAVHLRNLYRETQFVHVLGELLPGWLQPLAPDTPGRVKVNETELGILYEVGEGGVIESNRMHAILMKLFDVRMQVVVVIHFKLLAVASLIHASVSLTVELPLLNVF